jgi:hypothetical protein
MKNTGKRWPARHNSAANGPAEINRIKTIA